MNEKRPVGRPVGQYKGKYPTSIRGKRTRAYLKWCSMICRTTKPSHPAFKNYQSLGVKVCERWSGPGGFYNFVDDMGEPPEGLTLGRIDNYKGYEPSNCRWETWKEQGSNRRKRPQIEGSLRKAARDAGLPYHMVYQRIKLNGWGREEALTTPNRGVGHHRQFENRAT